MRKKLITAVLLSLLFVLLIGTTAFADTSMEAADEEPVCETVEEQMVGEPQEEEPVPEGAADITSVQSVPAVPMDNVETEEIPENKPDASSGGNYYIKFTQTTDEGEKTCQFYGGSEEGISVRAILNALQPGYYFNENTVIDVVEDSVDTAVIGVRKTDGDIFITDQGMFSKADKDLVILVNGEEISLSVFDDISYLTPVYIDDSDVTKGIQNWETKSVSVEEVTDSTESVTWGVEGESTWYAVTETVKTVTLSKGVICKGNVNLILCDGTTIEVNGANNAAGILVSGYNNSLTIYAQSTGDTAGKLIANGGVSGAGIGGGAGLNGNNITVNGGTVTASGGYSGAGIGGGSSGTDASFGDGINITVNGGTVTASGGMYAAGIGGGYGCGDGFNITINGGTVNATGYYEGAGIGGGYHGDAYDIIINGGTVTTTGIVHGAGIGGGNGGNANGITINGGTVQAAGGSRAAGIGGGNTGDAYGITMNGGIVSSTAGEKGAGIGGGFYGNGINITINGGSVTATGDDGGAGIGAGLHGYADKIKAAAGLLVYAGQNSSELRDIEHTDHTDLSKVADFSSSPCVQILSISRLTSTTGGVKVEKIPLKSLTAAQRAAIEQFIKENNLEAVIPFVVYKDGSSSNDNHEPVDFTIDPEWFSELAAERLKIFMVEEDNTISQVPFTRENGKIAINDCRCGLFFIGGMKRK